MKTTQFSDRPVLVKSLILGGGLCLVIGLFFFLDIRPRFIRIEHQKKMIKSLTNEIEQYRRKIIGFKKPTKEEIEAWDSLTNRLKRRVPPTKDVLKAARLLADKAVEAHLMSVAIKMAVRNTSQGVVKIAGKEKSPPASDPTLKALKIHSFLMEVSYTSSLKDSLTFLDALTTDSEHFLQLENVKLEKDFPFIHTEALVRFYYGGDLDVKK